MWQEERFSRIRGLLATFYRIPGERIESELNVSRETVRRDLIELEARGALRRVHGGAVRIDQEPPLTERTQIRVRAKRAIARRVAREIESGQTLFLDAGSTTSIVAAELAGLAGLIVITNSFDAALQMNAGADQAERKNRVIVLGGYLGENLSATFGDITVSDVHRYHVDAAVLSPVGLDTRYGATSFDQREAEVARAMVANADRVIITADHSKIGAVSRVSYCAIERVDLLVTNATVIDQTALTAISQRVKEVALAD